MPCGERWVICEDGADTDEDAGVHRAESVRHATHMETYQHAT